MLTVKHSTSGGNTAAECNGIVSWIEVTLKANNAIISLSKHTIKNVENLLWDNILSNLPSFMFLSLFLSLLPNPDFEFVLKSYLLNALIH